MRAFRSLRVTLGFTNGISRILDPSSLIRQIDRYGLPLLPFLLLPTRGSVTFSPLCHVLLLTLLHVLFSCVPPVMRMFLMAFPFWLLFFIQFSPWVLVGCPPHPSVFFHCLASCVPPLLWVRCVSVKSLFWAQRWVAVSVALDVSYLRCQRGLITRMSMTALARVDRSRVCWTQGDQTDWGGDHSGSTLTTEPNVFAMDEGSRQCSCPSSLHYEELRDKGITLTPRWPRVHWALWWELNRGGCHPG